MCASGLKQAVKVASFSPIVQPIYFCCHSTVWDALIGTSERWIQCCNSALASAEETPRTKTILAQHREKSVGTKEWLVPIICLSLQGRGEMGDESRSQDVLWRPNKVYLAIVGSSFRWDSHQGKGCRASIQCNGSVTEGRRQVDDPKCREPAYCWAVRKVSLPLWALMPVTHRDDCTPGIHIFLV